MTLRRIILVVCVVVIAGSALFANSSDAMLSITMLIEDGVEENAAAIYDLSAGLSLNQKYLLFDRHKPERLVPVALNFLLGFGVGSFMQGDTSFGTLGLIGDVGGLSLTFAGFIVFGSSLTSATSTLPSDAALGFGIAFGGILVYMVSRTIQMIRPWVYANGQEKLLKQALGLLPYGHFHIAPVVGRVATLDGYDNTYGARVGLSF